VLAGGVVVAALVLGFRIQPRPDYVVVVAAMVLSGLLVSRASGLHPQRLTVPGVWYLSYIVGTAAPALLVVAEVKSRYVAPYLLAVIVTLFTAPLGMLLVNAATGFRRDESRAFFDEPLPRQDPGPAETSAFLLLLGGCLVLTAGYVIETPVIPLFHLIRNPGSAAVIVGLREDSFKLLDSPFIYAYDVIRNVIWPFVITLALGYWLTSRRPRWLALLLVAAMVGTFYAAASVAKAPVAVLALVTVLFMYLYRRGRVSLRTALIGFGLVFVFPLAVLFWSVSGLGFGPTDVFRAIVRRLFYAPAEVLYNYFVVVPDVVPYLYGRTIGRVQWVLGESEINIGNFVFRFMFPNRIETGVANTSFIGYMHADFGLPGILLGGALVGALVQSLQVWLVRRPKTVESLAAYAFLYWAAWKINFQALPQTMLSGGILVVLVLVAFLRHAAGFFSVATARPEGEALRP
jgi:hypothetical protein